MTSRKLTIIFTSIVGVLILLAGGALLLVKVLVTPEMVRKHVLPRVEKAVHRRIDMVDAKIGLFSGIALRGVKVYEKDNKETFVSVGEARLHYQILPLLSRKVVVDEIVLDSPDIRIVRNSDGLFNFSDLLRKEETIVPVQEEKTPLSFAVAQIKVSNGRVVYVDRKGLAGSPFEYTVQKVNIDIKNLTPDRPFPLELTATVPGGDLGFSGTVERITDGPVLDGQLAFTAADLAETVAGLPSGISAKLLSLSPHGRIAAKLHLSGAVKEPRAMLKDGEVRLEKVTLAAGGLSPELSGRVDLAEGALGSRDLSVVLGKNRVSLQLKTSPLDRKPLAVELSAHSDSLDIDALSPSKKAEKGVTRSEVEGGETEPGPLKLPLSLSGAVNVRTAVVKGLVLSGISLRYRLADNILTVEDFKGSTAGGSFLDNARVNLGTRGFTYSTRLSLQGAQVDRIVAAFAPKAAGKISGTLSLKADLSGNGTKPVAMKRNLAGSGSFEVKNGKLTGSGFAGELARFLGSEELRIVRFSTFAGTYRIRNRQVFLDSALEGSDIRMKPKGRIGFDKSLDISLDTRIAPRIIGTVARGAVGSFITDEQGWGVLPLKATGTVGSPRFTLSGKAVGRQIEEKIGETIRKKLGKDTGTDQKKEGPKLEDTIRGILGN